MNRYLLLILFFCLGATGQVYAYKNVKVILVADRQDQHDSLGYNFVSEITRHVYEWVQNGQVTLWNSPEKSYTLTKEDLQKLEAQRSTQFTSLPYVFMYEYWTSRRRSFASDVRGISFASATSSNGEELFGYIEFDEKVEKLMAEAYLRVNANANYGITLLEVLMNKSYDFALVYFDDGPVRNYKDGQRIVKHALNPKKKKKNAIAVTPARLVEYSIEIGSSAQAVLSSQIMKDLQEFFKQNPQEFFNYGGDEILPYTKKMPIIITRLHVQELWTQKNGRMYYKPLQIVPYVVGVPMKPIPITQLNEWQVKVYEQPLETTLLEKQFYYRIVKVNGTWAGEAETLWKQALLNGNWSNLIQTKIQHKGNTNDNTN